MKIYLAGFEKKLMCPSGSRLLDLIKEYGLERIYVLSSFYFMRPEFQKYIPLFKDFLLDSGAFSFMNSNTQKVNWDEYLEKYIDFTNMNKIEKFFELDIDSLVGYDKVKEFRYRLERSTGRQVIPVWHKSRGLEEFFRMCKEYDYVSIGGIAIGDIKPVEYKFFTYLINEAHKRSCKIHGLGATGITITKKYHFDTADSSAWTVGGRYGNMYFFRHGDIRISKRQEGRRVIDVKDLDVHNLREFLKYQEWAEVHL